MTVFKLKFTFEDNLNFVSVQKINKQGKLPAEFLLSNFNPKFEGIREPYVIIANSETDQLEFPIPHGKQEFIGAMLIELKKECSERGIELMV